MTKKAEKKVVDEKPAAKPKATRKKVAKSKIQYVRFQNNHTKTLRVHGASLRPKELSRSFTAGQAKAMETHMKPFLDAGMIKKISV